MTTYIDPLPPPPTRQMDAATYVAAFNAWIASLPNLVTGINAAQLEMTNNTSGVVQAASTAQAAAASATSSANVHPWTSDTTYEKYASAISNIDFQTYRCIIAGASSTDPSLDSAKWVQLSGIATMTPTQSLASLHAASISF